MNDRTWVGQLFGLWPAWFWCLGIWLFILLSHHSWKKTTVLLFVWILFLACYSEEWRWVGHIFRSSQNTEWESRHTEFITKTQDGIIPVTWKQNYPLRISSYNVNGNLDALKSVAQYHPDICLFQEIPHATMVNQNILQLFGPKAQYFDGGDCAILTRFPVKVLPQLSLRYAGPAVRVQFDIPNQKPVTIMDIRLLLPSLELDFLSPDAWRFTQKSQLERNEQMKILLYSIDSLQKSSQILLGGDFNRPARAASLNPLRRLFLDSYAQSGIGWGNTMTVDFPVSRIDQIWIPKNWKPIKSRVILEGHSDHRLLISDVDVAQNN